ncbi:CGNR zinc finger domain-containing protein [Achromobacter insuavis]
MRRRGGASRLLRRRRGRAGLAETGRRAARGRRRGAQGLRALALRLRDNARSLVHAAKHEGASDASVVNQVLQAGRASKELLWDDASASFKVVTQRRHDDAASFLEPIAQAVVHLLTDTQLELVRQCEAHDCTLMFHDKTKSHRRRWCSMAVCGNRMKVAAFRSRKKGE